MRQGQAEEPGKAKGFATLVLSFHCPPHYFGPNVNAEDGLYRRPTRTRGRARQKCCQLALMRPFRRLLQDCVQRLIGGGDHGHRSQPAVDGEGRRLERRCDQS